MLAGARWQVVACLAACAGLGLTGCGVAATASPAARPAQQFDVHLDAPADAATPAVYPAYFPSAIVAHPGDRIVFHASAQGQAHTVTFGRSVDAAMAPLDGAAQVSAGGGPERGALAAFPRLVTAGRVTQTLARPCSLAESWSEACTAPERPFTGHEALFGSGVLASGSAFTVALDPSIPAGTYRFFCAVMRTAMTGRITVVAGDQAAPGPPDVQQQAQSEQQTRADILTGSIPAAGPAHVVGGVSVDGVGLATVFTPRHVSIPVGGSVTWTLTGATVSFDVPESLWLAQFQTRPDGSVQWSPAPLTSIPPVPTTIAWDGRSPRSSGAPAATFPPATSTFTLRFTAPGTYAYQCLLHADMSGLVTVG